MPNKLSNREPRGTKKGEKFMIAYIWRRLFYVEAKISKYKNVIFAAYK